MSEHTGHEKRRRGSSLAGASSTHNPKLTALALVATSAVALLLAWQPQAIRAVGFFVLVGLILAAARYGARIGLGLGALAGMLLGIVCFRFRPPTDQWGFDSILLLLSLPPLGWVVGATTQAGVNGTSTATGPPGSISEGVLALPDGLHALDCEIARAHAHGRPLGLVTVRSSLLEQNNSHAHEHVSRGIERAVLGHCNAYDLPFAVSGEELAVILPERDSADLHLFAAAVLGSVQGAHVPRTGDAPLGLITDLAAIEVRLAEAETLDTLLDGGMAAHLLQGTQGRDPSLSTVSVPTHMGQPNWADTEAGTHPFQRAS